MGKSSVATAAALALGSKYTDGHGLNSASKSKVCQGSEVDCCKKEHLFSIKKRYSA